MRQLHANTYARHMQDETEEDLGKIFMRTGDLINPPRLFVMGDSHALFFAGAERMEATHSVVPFAHQGYRVYYLGPGLAGSLIKPHSRNRTREKINMALQEPRQLGVKTIVFVFGEVDCRYHIRAHAEKMRADKPEFWLASARITVLRYVAFLLDVRLQGFMPAVWAPIASTPNPPETHRWITRGTTPERNWITKHFVDMLKEECDRHAIPVLSLFEQLVDEKLNTKPDFSSDGVHLSQHYWPLWLELAKGAGII